MNHSPTAVPSAVESITVTVVADGCSDTRDMHTTHTRTALLSSVAVYSIISSVYMKPSAWEKKLSNQVSQINNFKINAFVN